MNFKSLEKDNFVSYLLLDDLDPGENPETADESLWHKVHGLESEEPCSVVAQMVAEHYVAQDSDHYESWPKTFLIKAGGITKKYSVDIDFTPTFSAVEEK